MSTKDMQAIRSSPNLLVAIKLSGFDVIPVEVERAGFSLTNLGMVV